MLPVRFVLLSFLCFSTCILGCGTGRSAGQVVPGPPGPAGPAGITFRGPYVNGTMYGPTDGVSFNGSSYVALASSSGVHPVGDPSSSTVWTLLAKAGDDGAPGPAGQSVQGPAGPPGPPGPPGKGSGPDVGTTSTDTTLYNVVFGAFNTVPTGDSDTVFGVGAGSKLTTGREMTIIGARACGNFDGDPSPKPFPENGLSTCIGSLAGANMSATGAFPSIDNVFVGQKAGLNGTALAEETLVGTHSGTSILTGKGDTVIGAHSVDGGVANSSNTTVVGYFSLNAAGNQTILNTTVLGSRTGGSLLNSSDNILIGYNSTQLKTADNAVIIGDYAGTDGTQISGSVLIGSQVARNAPSRATVVGSYAGVRLNAPGTLLGFGAGSTITAGPADTCVGDYSCGSLSTGENNTAIGAGAGSAMSGAESFNTSMGANATTAPGVSNAAQIGSGTNATSNSLQFNASQIIDGNGDLHASSTPPSSNSACTVGAVRIAMPYIYACVSTNLWMRATLNAF